MLKNASSAPVVMLWGGETVTLLPGQSCRYKDPRVELRQQAKHGAVLQHTPEPQSEHASKSQVVMDDAPRAAPDPVVPTVGHAEESAETTDALACSVCAFIAKTPAGLDSHIRSKHST